MHILLTDHLACPRCGPEAGLILLADRIEERRVLEGWLGCPGCGTRYPIRAGFADLRASRVVEPVAGEAGEADEPGRPPEVAAGGAGEPRARPAGPEEPEEGAALEEPPEPGGPEAAMRTAALLGIDQGPGFALVLGPGARLAPGIAELVPGLEVVAADPALAAWPEEPGVNRIAWDGAWLPFFARTMRGVALTGPVAGRLVDEGARVLHPLGRLLLEESPPDADDRLSRAGLRVLARQGRTVVAGLG